MVDWKMAARLKDCITVTSKSLVKETWQINLDITNENFSYQNDLI